MQESPFTISQWLGDLPQPESRWSRMIRIVQCECKRIAPGWLPALPPECICLPATQSDAFAIEASAETLVAPALRRLSTPALNSETIRATGSGSIRVIAAL